LHYNFGIKRDSFLHYSRVLKITRYYILDNFMENFQKTICQINLQFSVFTHISQTPLRADSKSNDSIISNISGFSENRQLIILRHKLVLDNLKLLFMCGSAVIPCFDPITQDGMNAGLIKQQFVVPTNIVSIFYWETNKEFRKPSRPLSTWLRGKIIPNYFEIFKWPYKNLKFCKLQFGVQPPLFFNQKSTNKTLEKVWFTSQISMSKVHIFSITFIS
jgi:hypothetical protein